MHGQLPFCLCLLVTGLMSGLCRGATWDEQVESRDGKCVLSDGSLKADGERWYDDEACVRYECTNSSGTYLVSGSSCGVRKAPAGCRLEPRPGHYPKCCPKPVCN